MVPAMGRLKRTEAAPWRIVVRRGRRDAKQNFEKFSGARKIEKFKKISPQTSFLDAGWRLRLRRGAAGAAAIAATAGAGTAAGLCGTQHPSPPPASALTHSRIFSLSFFFSFSLFMSITVSLSLLQRKGGLPAPQACRAHRRASWRCWPRCWPRRTLRTATCIGLQVGSMVAAVRPSIMSISLAFTY